MEEKEKKSDKGSPFPGKVCPICESRNLSRSDDGKAVCLDCGATVRPTMLLDDDSSEASASFSTAQEENSGISISNASKGETEIRALSSDREQQRATLEYGLFAWWTFFQKGREIEESIPIKDDDYPDPETPLRYRDDITERKGPSFVNSSHQYFDTAVAPTLSGRYEEHARKEKNRLLEEAEKRGTYYPQYVGDVKRRRWDYKDLGLLLVFGFFSIVFFVLLIWSWALALGIDGFWVVPFFMAIGLLVTGAIFVYLYVTKFRKQPWQKASYGSWLNQHANKYIKVEPFDSFCEAYKRDFDAKTLPVFQTVQSEVSRLREDGIKGELIRMFPLPLEFNSEFGVSALLYIFLKGRADSMEEAEKNVEIEFIRSQIPLDTKYVDNNVPRRMEEIDSALSQGMIDPKYAPIIERSKTLISKIEEIKIDKLDSIPYEAPSTKPF